MAVSGKEGSVAVGGVDYAFGKWSLDIDGDLPDVTNFTSGGCDENVAGIDGATVSLEGPFKPGFMPLARGTVYVFTLRVSATATFSISARVKTISPSTDVKDAARIKVTAKSTGVFTPSIS